MSGTSHLPPNLEQRVQLQLSTGRFHDENEVMSAALNLLDEQVDQAIRERRLERAFGLWEGRELDGLAYERHLREEN